MPKEHSTYSVDGFAGRFTALLTWAYGQSQGLRWGLSLGIFTEALSRSVSKRFPGTEPVAGDVEGYVKSLHLEDLGLACACVEGIDAAWEFFVAAYKPQLRSAAAGILLAAHHTDPARAQELADSIYAELYGIRSSNGARGKSLFVYFHGRSKLSTWLRALLAQRHIDQIRAAKRFVSVDGDDVDDGRAGAVIDQGSNDPPIDPDRVKYLAYLDGALSAALSALPARDRLVLSFYYLDQLTLRDIGRTLGEHESTISRQLDRTRRQLRDAVAQSLAAGAPMNDGAPARPLLSPAQVEMAFEYAVEDWPFDLSKALTGGKPEVGQEA